MLIVWLSNIIDTKGIGNGTSIIIFTNIVVTLINKNLFSNSENNFFGIESIFILFLTLLICISQTARINIEVVSARQLAFLENIEKRNLSDNKSSKKRKLDDEDSKDEDSKKSKPNESFKFNTTNPWSFFTR